MTSLTDTLNPPGPAPAPAGTPRSAAPEKPVFAATGSARPRALRLAGRMVAGLVGLWLVALVLGAFGLGPVPGFQLPGIGGGDKPANEAARLVNPAATASVHPRVVAMPVTNAVGSTARTIGRRQAGSPGAHRRGQHPTPGRGGSPGSTGNGNGNAISPAPGATNAPAGSSVTPAPAATSTGSTTTSTPSNGHSQAQSHPHSSNSNASPPGSSSTAPGSRSQATTAPGRQNSSAAPVPGSGQAEHKPPKG